MYVVMTVTAMAPLKSEREGDANVEIQLQRSIQKSEQKVKKSGERCVFQNTQDREKYLIQSSQNT